MKYVAEQIKNLNLFKALLLSFILLNVISAISSKAHAGPARTTYQAKIIKPDGYPLEAASVNFKFTILDPVGTCILYSETYSAVNMSATGGLISFALGSGVKTYPVSATTFEQVFSNITPALSCDAGGPPTYSPAAIDSRKVVMQFHDGNGWQTLPAMTINAVPYAMYADQASNLNGKTDTDFVQIAGLPSCLSTEALRFNGTSFSCVNTASVSAAAVVAALGYTPATGASVTAIASSLSMTDADLASVSSTVFSVSSTVSSLSNSVSTLQSTVAASFATLTSSQWVTSGTTINYMNGNVGIGTTSPTDALTVSGSIRSSRSIALGDGLVNSTTATINAASFAWYGWYLGGVRTAFIQSSASEYSIFSQTSGVPMTFYTSSAERMRITASGSVGIGTVNPTRKLQVVSTSSGGDGISIENTTSPYLLIRRDALNEWFTVAASTTNTLEFRSGNIANSSTLALNANNSFVGIGTNAPVTRLDVSGAIRISMDSATCAVSYAGTLRYNAGSLEMCNGTAWSAFGLASAGLNSLNGLTSATQTFANSLTGTTPAFASLNGVHTLNIPLASAGSVTAGLISNADYVSFSNKITSSTASVAQALGYVPASATALNNYLVRANNLSDLTSSASARTNLGLGGFATVSSLDLGSASATGTIALARLPSSANVTSGTQYTKVTVDGYGRVTSGGQLSVTDVTAALGYTPASATAATQWNTSGTTINYTNGNVGIGTSTPQAKLHIQNNASTSSALNILSNSTAIGSTNTAVNLDMSAGSVNQANTGFNISNSTSSDGSATGLNIGLNSRNNTYGVSVTATKNWFGGALTGSVMGVYSNVGTDSSLAYTYSGYFNNTASTGTVAYGLYTNINTGATDAAPFVAAVAGSEKFRISSSGNVGIGITNPSARLQIAAGTASLAPLKLTSGTLTTSPQSGTMEYDGFNFYLTDGTNNRRTIATGSSAGAIDNASNINSTGNITMTPTGSVIVSSTTASTNSTTGALVVRGGVGVAGNVNASGTLNISGDASFGGNIFGNGNIHAGGNNRGFWMDTPNNFNYGIWRDLSNNVHIRSGGSTERLTIASSTGNVGIGTSAPTSKLNIANSMSFDPGANVTGAIALEGAYGGGLIFKDTNYAGIWAADNGQTLNFSSSGTTGGFGGGAYGQMVLKASNVGIGTTNPKARLQLGVADWIGFEPQQGTSGLYFNEVGTMSASGGLTTHGARLFYDGTNDLLRFTTIEGSVEFPALNIARTTGNVGIGTTIPEEKLHVSSGGILLDNAYFIKQKDEAGVARGLLGTLSDGTVMLNGWHQNPVITAVNGATYLSGGISDNVTIMASGNVGIGTTSPIWPLQVNANNSGGMSNGITLNTYENGSAVLGANYRAFSARGTANSPANVITGDTLAAFTGSGYWSGKVNSYFENGEGRGSVSIAASEDWVSSSNNGTYMSFMTTLNGTSAQAERMRISNDGNVGIGTSNTQTAKLQIKGPNLGYNLNDAVEIQRLTSDIDNVSYLDFRQIRTSAGTNWFSAGTRMQSKIDNTWMGYMQFNGNGNDGGISFGTGQTVVAPGNTTERLRITETGNVGIGTSTPTQLFENAGGRTAFGKDAANNHWFTTNTGTFEPNNIAFGFNAVSGTVNEFIAYTSGTQRLKITSYGYVGIGTMTPSEMLEVSGSVKAVAYLHTSDVRLKKDIITLPDALENALKLRGVNFVWKNNNEKTIGFIAQEVEAVYPELVKTDKVTGYKAVQYGNIVAILVEALKEEHAQRIRSVANVEEKSNLRMNQLEKENQELKARLEKIEKFLSEKIK